MEPGPIQSFVRAVTVAEAVAPFRRSKLSALNGVGDDFLGGNRMRAFNLTRLVVSAFLFLDLR